MLVIGCVQIYTEHPEPFSAWCSLLLRALDGMIFFFFIHIVIDRNANNEFKWMFDTVGDHDPTKCNYTLDSVCVFFLLLVPLDIKCGINRHNYVHNTSKERHKLRNEKKRTGGKTVWEQ